MGERGGRAFDRADPVLAAAAWSRLAEPGDRVAGAIVSALGPVAALDRVLNGAAQAPAGIDAVAWERHRARWEPRMSTLDPRRELEVVERLGGRVVLRGDPEWPVGLDDLGDAAPYCLWVRGVPVSSALTRSAAIVGSRACTAYGRHVAAELGAGLAQRSMTVVSGGAYGIDAAAHRGALAATGRTVAVLAGGVDRPYPAGNADLLAEIGHRGALVAEVPPGSAPTRSRFLQRNRLIAALTRGVVVVEAAWRSGALSTAAHAASLLRPVGAVPGPVTSATSAGCHRLLREADAVCVTDADEVAELVGTMGLDLAPDARDGGTRASASRGAPPDGLGEDETRVFEAVPLRGRAPTSGITRAAGLAELDVRVALARLELAGLVDQEAGRWRRSRV